MRLCSISDIPEDGGLKVDTPDGLSLAVFLVDGAVHVIQDRCSHAEASMSDGFAEDNWVECPVHGGRFDITTGAPIKAPCTTPIKVYPATVEGDDVHIAV